MKPAERENYIGKTHLMRYRDIDTDDVILWCGGKGHTVYTVRHFTDYPPERRCGRCGMLRDLAEAKSKGRRCL